MHRSEDSTALFPLTTRPVPRLGIIGGGQLAKMTAAAAASFGCEVVVLERQEDFPAQSLDTHAIIGDWNDPQELQKLGPLVDVVTMENEFVDADSLGTLSDNSHVLWPHVNTLRMVQDKLRQKRTFAEAGLPVARFADVKTREDILAFELPAVLKKRYNSYDGKGNATVHTISDIEPAWSRLNGDSESLYIEEFCSFERELAIIVTRGQDGSSVHYPVVETINRSHICHVVKAPADVSPGISIRVADYAVKAVEAIDGVGSFGVEFFLLPGGEIVLNEIAPRVHNTGHYTIEACECSQFENHVRAVLGWPLGSSRMVAPAAVMVNLLGFAEGSGMPQGLAEALRVEGAHVHVYGKTRSERGRKMGHVTALGNNMETALLRAQRAADCIRFGGDK